jgi:shikimate dehydrogenase
MHQAAFDHLGLEARYELWEVPPQGLGAKLVELRGAEYLGANVTIPHKEAVIPLLDQVDDLARRIGAVNTILNQGERLTGFNTDAQGFITALRREGGLDPRGRRVVILGAGGASRAAAFMLIQQGAAHLTIVNRNLERAAALARDVGEAVVQVCSWEPGPLATALATCHLVVNCTPLGTKGSLWEGKSPLPADLIPAQALVYDLVYNPPQTPLLAAAREAGARTLNGLPMLVYQGGASFELWTGREAPLAVMYAAAQRALGLAD